MPEVSTKTLLIIFSLIAVSLAIGFGVGYNFKNAPFSRQSQAVPNKSLAGQNLIFKTQTASIEGKITDIENNTTTITNDQGQSDSFLLSTKLVIYKPEKEGSPRASASTDIKSINLNQKSLIILEMVDGKYQVVSISHDNF